jgi:SAM-dependent methyltransferase
MSRPPEFKDLFSHQSTDYVRYRPTYPESLFRYLSSLVSSHELAWDCGTGNGQAAIQLTEFFDKVIATDPSAKQISKAIQHPKVEYRTDTAEKSTLNRSSVDLITVGQAFHWFHQHEFFDEVQRILKPQGILAFWCYGLAQITPEIDSIVFKLYRDILGDYWEKERQLIEEGYQNILLPMKELKAPKFEMTAEWDLEHLVGYLSTWSALQTYIQKNQSNPLETVFNSLQKAWDSKKTRTIKWELGLRVGQKTSD